MTARKIALAFTAAALMNCASAQTIPIDNASACMEGPLAEFGRYIGNWDIRDEQLAQDGSGWKPGAGAQWNFVCVGDGTAIQDFWIPNGGAVGTNLRTYSSEKSAWDIAWTIKGMPGPGFAHISAKAQDDGRIVMEYVAPIPNPLRRITFFPPEENAWNWKLEMSTDDGANWTEVYRIFATRSE